jgi:SSS family solute:Na+ symporter
MVAALLPAGIRGLVAGGLLAALMSSLAAVFNSSSTLFTMDIYKKLHPDASERTLVVVGKIATAVLVATGIAWIPFLRSISGELYHYLQSVQAYIAPPIAAVFLLGLFFKRINAAGAVAALGGGFFLGMARLVAEINKDSLDGWLLYFTSINFLHFCVLLFLACVAILVGVSLVTKPPEEEQIRGLTYATTVSADKAASRASWTSTDVVHSAAIVAIVLAVLLYFSPLRAYLVY